MKPLLPKAFLVLSLGFASVVSAQETPKADAPPPATETVQAPTPTPPPAPAKADPSALWNKITPGLQVRTRYEYRNNYDLMRKLDKIGGADRDNFVLLRTRFSLNAKPVDGVEIFAQIQDSREFGSSKLAPSPYGPGNAVRNDATMGADNEGTTFHQAYFRMQVPHVDGLSFQAGRQEFKLGEERLVGALDWSNRGRSFDGGIMTYAKDKVRFDGFLFLVVRGDANAVRSSRTATTLSAKGINEDTRFGGFNLQFKDDQAGIIEGYYLNLTDRDAGTLPSSTTVPYPANLAKKNDLIIHTAGLHLFKKPGKGAADWSFEGAFQWGQDGYIKHRAGAGHLALGFTADADLQPRLMLEYNFATGGDDYAAGKTYAFKNLFPTNHNKYGAIDFMNWSNVHDLHPEISAVVNDVKLIVGYHEFLAFDPNGAIGDNSAKLIAIGTHRGRQFGRELDLMASGKPYESVNVLLGYSLFNSGNMWWQSEPTVKPNNAHFVYLQGTVAL